MAPSTRRASDLRLITDAAAFRPRAEVLLGRSRIAIDTEGDGMFRYRARLCVVQLADETEIDLLDTLAMKDLSDLGRVLGGGPVKVVHDATFDVRQLGAAGIALAPLLDTSVMAKFLGEPALGLGALVEKYVGVTLDKSKQQEDWGARPLPEEHLPYLADDVRYLLELADALWGKVVSADIAEEVEEECRYVLWSAARPDDGAERPAWQRIKGADRLAEPAQAILRELCLERERLAADKDVPPYRIAMNQALLDLAVASPRGRDDYSRIKGAPRPAWIREPLIAALKRGQAAKTLPEQEKRRADAVPPREVREARKKAHGAITTWRLAEAKKREVSDQAVLPGHCLQDLLDLRPQSRDELERVPGLGRVRIDRYAETLLTFFRN